MESTCTTPFNIKRFLHFSSFLNLNQQKDLVSAVFELDDTEVEELQSLVQTSHKSKSLNLKLPNCGASLHENLPLAVHLARRAFQRAVKIYMDSPDCRAHNYAKEISSLIDSSPRDGVGEGEPQNLTGIALIYGLKASMSPHYDSPVENQRYEWLCMFSMGCSIRFRCDNEILLVCSGDAVVIDSMNVFHGVESVQDDSKFDKDLDFPFPMARLGVLLVS